MKETGEQTHFFSSAAFNKKFFFARRSDERLKIDRVDVLCADGTKLACSWMKCPNQNRKTLIHFHGSGELVLGYVRANDIPERITFKQVAEELCLDVFFVEYRGYGDSTGKECLPQVLSDINAIYDHLKLPQEDLFVYGRSIGALFAVHFVHEYPNVAGLILDSPLANVEPMMDRYDAQDLKDITQSKEDLKQELVTLLNMEEKLTNFKGHAIIFCCSDDKILTLDHPTAIVNWIAGKESKKIKATDLFVDDCDKEKVVTTGRCTVVCFAIGGHNYIWWMNTNSYRYHLRDFALQNGHVIPKGETESTTCLMS
eukprot:TRINITY_DN10216_c0_g1_i1.p1 TRINITY_DN10216_c0_g1~~TRINITY_DN10216_c0_g1_i1.p1  ORF type:complete len:326 (+),score=32.99 TRINITY_DN10216_c0_g1_i1:41-979(+)